MFTVHVRLLVFGSDCVHSRANIRNCSRIILFDYEVIYFILIIQIFVADAMFSQQAKYYFLSAHICTIKQMTAVNNLNLKPTLSVDLIHDCFVFSITNLPHTHKIIQNRKIQIILKELYLPLSGISSALLLRQSFTAVLSKIKMTKQVASTH